MNRGLWPSIYTWTQIINKHFCKRVNIRAIIKLINARKTKHSREVIVFRMQGCQKLVQNGIQTLIFIGKGLEYRFWNSEKRVSGLMGWIQKNHLNLWYGDFLYQKLVFQNFFAYCVDQIKKDMWMGETRNVYRSSEETYINCMKIRPGELCHSWWAISQYQNRRRKEKCPNREKKV